LTSIHLYLNCNVYLNFNVQLNHAYLPLTPPFTSTANPRNMRLTLASFTAVLLSSSALAAQVAAVIIDRGNNTWSCNDGDARDTGNDPNKRTVYCPDGEGDKWYDIYPLPGGPLAGGDMFKSGGDGYTVAKCTAITFSDNVLRLGCVPDYTVRT